MPTTASVDLAADRLDDVRVFVESAFGVVLNPDTARYGNKGDTVGFASDTGLWVRLQWRPPTVLTDAWFGPESASVLPGVAMPRLFRSVRWPDPTRAVIWRADEFQLITDHAVSGPGSIDTAPLLTQTWWATLRESLVSLAGQGTPRVAMSGDHLARRITEVFGKQVAGVDLTVPEWTTAHGDFHWGNLTAPTCYLLDWESWGRAPRGYDAATLWGFSLGAPEIAEQITAEFADDLRSRSGLLSQLLFCANVMRQSSRRGVEMPFTAGVRAAVSELLDAVG